MSYEESKDRELFEKLLQRVAGLEEKEIKRGRTSGKIHYNIF